MRASGRGSKRWARKGRSRLTVVIGATAAIGLSVPGGATAATPPPPSQPAPLPTFVTNGPVNALTTGAGRVFVGGAFSRIGPLTGGAGALDSATAARDTAFPRVSGTVFAVTPDGTGGVYLGGSFAAVGGVARANLAHVLAGGAVDPGFDPEPDGQVLGMAIVGGKLYFGGDFLHVGATIRRRLAAVSLPTGASPVSQLDAGFNPGVDGSVQDVVGFGTRLYVDGRFQGVAGQSREGIAAIDTTTGSLDPGFDVSINGPVDALLVIGGKLFAGGLFSDVGGHSRAGLAAFDAATGALDTTFSPATNGQVYDLATDDGTNLFVAGRFTEIGRAFDNSVASLDPATGAAHQPFRFFADKDAYAVTYAAGRLYIGGEFTTINNLPGNRLVAADATTGAIETAFDPDPDNDVYAVALVGNDVIAGGKFISAPRTVAANLTAIDAATGVTVPGFSAGVSGAPTEDRGQVPSISALTLAGGRLYAGGSFGAADGVKRNDLASFDPLTGALGGTPPPLDGPVAALAGAGTRVYVGGRFTKAGTDRHPSLLALVAASGAVVRPFNLERPSTRLVTVTGSRGRQTRVRRKVLLPGLLVDDGSVDALLAAGGRLFVGGDVTSVAQVGQGRRRHHLDGVLGLAAATGKLITAFDTPLDSGVQSLAAAGRTLYAGGEFDQQIGTRVVHPRHGKPFKVGVYRENLIALDTARGRPRSGFQADADDPVTALATDGNELYVGGSFRHVAGRPRVRLAAVSPGSGRLSTTFTPAPDDSVSALALLGPRLFVGGPFRSIGAGLQPYLAAFQPPAAN
jgi:hypothetical protein